MANTDEVYGQEQTLQRIIDRQPLPAVARTSREYVNNVGSSWQRVTKGTVIFLEKIKPVSFVRMKVLRYQDEEKAIQELGHDQVAERGIYEDDEYLVPRNYQGKLKYVHRPGTGTRYASVSQVMSDMPRMLRMEEDVVCISAGKSNKNTVIPAQTLLQVNDCYVGSIDKRRYLNCTSGQGQETYSLQESTRINCTVVDDPYAYTLDTLIKSKSFPAVLQFQKNMISNVVHFDHGMSTIVHSIVEGPIELLGSFQIDVVVGWVRDSDLKSYRTLILPMSMWSGMHVQQMMFDDDTLRDSYIARRFLRQPDAGFVDRGLYLLRLDDKDAVWLKSPLLFRTGANNKTSPVEIGFEDTTDEDELHDYEEIPPPLPARSPIATDAPSSVAMALQHKTDARPKLPVNKAAQRKKTLFGNVHSELISWFKRAKSKPSRQVKRSASNVVSGTKHNYELPSARAPSPSELYEIPQIDNSNVQESKCLTPCISERKFEFESQINVGSNTSKQTGKQNADISQIGNTSIPNRPPQLLPKDSGNSHSKSIANTPTRSLTTTSSGQGAPKGKPNAPKLTRPSRFVPEPIAEATISNPAPTSRGPIPAPEDNKLPVYDTVYPSTKKKPSPTGKQDTSMDMGEDPGKTPHLDASDIFYSLTVAQLVTLLRYCALDNIADVCADNKLDGCFFKDFDLSEMSDEPFNAPRLHVMKMKQIIHNGWRPKLD